MESGYFNCFDKFSSITNSNGPVNNFLQLKHYHITILKLPPTHIHRRVCVCTHMHTHTLAVLQLQHYLEQTATRDWACSYLYTSLFSPQIYLFLSMLPKSDMLHAQVTQNSLNIPLDGWYNYYASILMTSTLVHNKLNRVLRNK